MRVNVEKTENERKKSAVQFEEQEEGAKPGEAGKIVVEEESDSRKTVEK